MEQAMCLNFPGALEVCDILENLEKLVYIADFIPITLKWVGKRTRSRTKRRTYSYSKTCSSSSQETESEPKVCATSPNSPLEFSASERDQENSLKRKREQLVEKIEGLEKNKKSLKEALETVKQRRDMLMALNLELKQTKQQVQPPAIDLDLNEPPIEGPWGMD